jgi:hypothetical protein
VALAQAAGNEVPEQEADGKKQEIQSEFRGRAAQIVLHQEGRGGAHGEKGAGGETALRHERRKARMSE